MTNALGDYQHDPRSCIGRVVLTPPPTLTIDGVELATFATLVRADGYRGDTCACWVYFDARHGGTVWAKTEDGVGPWRESVLVGETEADAVAYLRRMPSVSSVTPARGSIFD